jgi:hypothetical protein
MRVSLDHTPASTFFTVRSALGVQAGDMVIAVPANTDFTIPTNWTRPNIWIMEAVERNTCLDDVTEEDVEDGRLNDDQIQALWNMTLEEAQRQQFCRIVAVCEGGDDASAKAAMLKALGIALG